MSAAVFYSTFRGNPYYNMAFDEWLMARAMGMPASTFLRLYSWYPGGISFGFNQRQETALDWTSVGETPVIRRVTGGRAIYHDTDELTYAIVVNMAQHSSARLVGSLSQVSAVLAEALAAFLKSQGVAAAYERASSPENAHPAFFHKAPCFESTAKYELLSGGRKIIASAQKRLGDVLLQHGSIKLHGVVHHSALQLVDETQMNEGKALTEERFKQVAEQFRLVMGRELGVDFAQSAEGEGAMPGLADRAAMVRARPLVQREIIAQSSDATSL